MSDALKMARLDLLCMKVYLKSYAIILLYPILFSWWSPASLSVVCSMMFAIMSTSIFSVQERNHLERLYGVFHLSKRSIVLGRYLNLFFHLCAGMLLVLPMYSIATLISHRPADFPEMLVSYGIAFLLFWLMTGIQTPIFFKLGYTKARLWAYLPFVLVGCTPIFGRVFPALTEAVASTVTTVFDGAEHNPWPLFFGCIATGLLILCASIPCSICLYRKQPA